MGISVRQVAGVGILIVSDDIQVPPVSIVGAGQLDVILIPNPSALPDTPYIIPLRIDNVEVGLQAVEWTAAEIAAAEPTPISFTGIDLAGVTSIIVTAGFDDSVAVIDAIDGSGPVSVVPIDVDVRMRDVPAAGLAGYIMNASLDGAIARFVGVTFPPAFPLGSHTPDPVSGPAVEFSAVDLNTVVNGGDVDELLATLQVELLGVGVTELQLVVTKLDDDGGFPIRSVTFPGTITVS